MNCTSPGDALYQCRWFYLAERIKQSDPLSAPQNSQQKTAQRNSEELVVPRLPAPSGKTKGWGFPIRKHCRITWFLPLPPQKNHLLGRKGKNVKKQVRSSSQSYLEDTGHVPLPYEGQASEQVALIDGKPSWKPSTGWGTSGKPQFLMLRVSQLNEHGLIPASLGSLLPASSCQSSFAQRQMGGGWGWSSKLVQALPYLTVTTSQSRALQQRHVFLYGPWVRSPTLRLFSQGNSSRLSHKPGTRFKTTAVQSRIAPQAFAHSWGSKSHRESISSPDVSP